MVKRHQEFTIIYNSECSKPKPKSGKLKDCNLKARELTGGGIKHLILYLTVAEIVRLVEEGERKKNKAVEKRDKVSFYETFGDPLFRQRTQLAEFNG